MTSTKDPANSFIPPLIIVFLSVIVYVTAFNGKFIWDDIPQILENAFIRDLKNIPSFFTADLGRYTAHPGFSSSYYRPLFLLSYAIDYSLWGLNPVGYHISNILLHSFCSLLVYAIGNRLLKERSAAFFAGAVFAIHPVHAETVAWIAGRADLLAAFFLFASFFLYIIFRDKGKMRFLGLSIGSYTLALFSKEVAVSFPLLLLIYEFSLNNNKDDKRFINKFSYPLLYMLVGGVYFISRVLAMGSLVLSNVDSPPFDRGRIYAIPGIIIDYVKNFIIPANLKIVYDVPLKYSFLSASVLLPVLILAVILLLVFLSYRGKRRLFFDFLWFFITLLPTLGPAGMVLMADRYLYIPSLGLCLLAGVFLSRISDLSISGLRYGKGLMLLVLIIFSVVTLQRNRIWSDELTYFKRAVEDAPRFVLHYNNLGKSYMDKKMYDESISVLKKAIELDPDYLLSRVTLGTAYYQSGAYEEALSEYKKAAELKPRNNIYSYSHASAYCGLGNVYRALGNMDEAIANWQTAISIRPDHSEANNNLGNVYLMRGNFTEAAERYRMALEGRPLNAEAHYNLAVTLERLGETSEAMKHYKIFVELGQNDYKELVQAVKRKFGYQ